MSLLQRRRSTKSLAEPPEPTEPRDLVAEHNREAEYRDRLLSHAPALASVAIFAFVTLKVLIISRNNVSTALTLVNRAGLLSTFSGILLLHLPAIGSGLSLVGTTLVDHDNLRTGERRRFWFYFGAAVFWLSWVVDWFFVVIVVATPLVLQLMSLRSKKKTKSKESARTIDDWLTTPPSDSVLRSLWKEYRDLENHTLANGSRIVDLSEYENKRQHQARILDAYNQRVDAVRTASRLRTDLVAASLLVVAIGPLINQGFMYDDPWLPAEILTIQNSRSVTGYVIDRDQDWTTILVEEDRSIRTVKSSFIQNRAICAPKDRRAKAANTLWRFVDKTKAANYPRCPE